LVKKRVKDILNTFLDSIIIYFKVYHKNEKIISLQHYVIFDFDM